MNLNNETVNANILYRYGEDDFSVWNLDLPTGVYMRLTSGDWTRSFKSWELLKKLPMVDKVQDSVFYVLENYKGEFTLYQSPEMRSFMKSYAHQGVSSRGTLDAILDEVDPKESQINIMWDDLRPETQARIGRMLGENGNFDVFLIHTIFSPEEEPIMQMTGGTSK